MNAFIKGQQRRDRHRVTKTARQRQIEAMHVQARNTKDC